MDRDLKVSLVWHGLPAYAARLIRGVVGTPGIDLQVFATKPPDDPAYLETILGQKINWIDDRTVHEHAAGNTADLCFVTGWAFETCNHFASVARARGARVVLMIDNRWRGDIRQQLGSIYFRLFIRRTVDFAWVPGSSAARLCRHLGLPDAVVTQGLYGGDGNLFADPTAAPRPPRIGFVGQLIPRKGFDILLSAFQKLRETAPEYELHVYGRGELAPLAANAAGVTLNPFSRPEDIASAMQTFRIFVMPSRDDNWPLALHEAALSGCTLVATRFVGNSAELIRESNGVVVGHARSGDLAAALRAVAEWPEAKHAAASIESRRLAEPYGPARWRREFLRLCADSTDIAR